jgi:hypothetical protein
MPMHVPFSLPCCSVFFLHVLILRRPIIALQLFSYLATNFYSASRHFLSFSALQWLAYIHFSNPYDLSRLRAVPFPIRSRFTPRSNPQRFPVHTHIPIQSVGTYSTFTDLLV